jgi:hypothetical protein
MAKRRGNSKWLIFSKPGRKSEWLIFDGDATRNKVGVRGTDKPFVSETFVYVGGGHGGDPSYPMGGPNFPPGPWVRIGRLNGEFGVIFGEGRDPIGQHFKFLTEGEFDKAIVILKNGTKEDDKIQAEVYEEIRRDLIVVKAKWAACVARWN